MNANYVASDGKKHDADQMQYNMLSAARIL